MKKLLRSFGALSVAALLAACEYDAPLTSDHTLPVDPALLGTWVQMPDQDSPDSTPEKMLIVAFSPTEYMVHYQSSPTRSSYYRAYPTRVGSVDCVQLELLCEADGAAVDPSRRYLVAKYQLQAGILDVGILDDDVVSTKLSGSEAIWASFLEHADDPGLFRTPGRFVRPTESSPDAPTPAGG